MSDVTCRSGVELLMEYLEGTLPDEMRVALDAHVSGCPRCAAFIASYQATPRILREATATTLPPDLADSLLAAIRRESKQD